MRAGGAVCRHRRHQPLQVGRFVDIGPGIEPRLLEFAVAVVSRYWGAHVEWVAHSRLAREAGIDAAVLKAVEDDRRPDFVNDDEAVMYDFVTELLNTRRVDDAT